MSDAAAVTHDSIAPPAYPKWWAAVLWTMLAGLAGHAYAGRLRRGALWWCADLGCQLLHGAALLTPWIGAGIWIASLLLVVAFRIAWIVDSGRTAVRQRGTPRQYWQRWWVVALIGVGFSVTNVIQADALRAFVAEGFFVPTRGMADTIASGDHILVVKAG